MLLINNQIAVCFYFLALPTTAKYKSSSGFEGIYLSVTTKVFIKRTDINFTTTPAIALIQCCVALFY